MDKSKLRELYLGSCVCMECNRVQSLDRLYLLDNEDGRETTSLNASHKEDVPSSLSTKHCRKCTRARIRAIHKSGNLADVLNEFTMQDLKDLMTFKEFSHLLNLLTKLHISSSPTYVHCPNKNCKVGFVYIFLSLSCYSLPALSLIHSPRYTALDDL